MIVPVPYRYDLVGLDPPATPSGVDAQVPLGAALEQVLELQQAHRGATIQIAQNVKATVSFGSSKNVDVLASTAAQVATICTLGRGFWQLLVCLSFNASYLPAFTEAADEINLQLRDPSNTISAPLIHGKLATNVPFAMNTTVRLLLVEDGFTLALSIPATGVGQTITVFGSVFGSKLL